MIVRPAKKLGASGPETVRYADPIIPNANTSLQDFDAGWQMVNGIWSRTAPEDAKIVQCLDYSAPSSQWRTLKHPSLIHGTTDRFTLLDGSVVPFNIYTPYYRIYEDHLFGLDIIYTSDDTYNWASSLHNPATDIGAGAGTGWVLPPIQVFYNIALATANHPLVATPVRPNIDYWSATPVYGDPLKALQFYNRNGSGVACLEQNQTALRRRFLIRLKTY